MIESIVVGTDGSPTAEQAVERAAALGKALGARIHLVSAYEPSPVRVAGGGEAARGELLIGPGVTVESVLEQAAGALRVKGIEVECYARKGDPAEAILDVAQEVDADLVILGSKGMRGTRRFLLGSVPNKVSHHAPCDVMIVRTGR
jgi:nucleotide-binding universal stress UspA family protein